MGIKNYIGKLLGNTNTSGGDDGTGQRITTHGSRAVFGSTLATKADAFISWTYICIDRNAQKLAQSKMILAIPEPEDFKSFNLSKSSKIKKQIEDGTIDIIDTSHPVVSILESPNNIQTYRQFNYQLYVMLQMWGAAYIYKLRNKSGQIIGMQLLDSRNVKLDFDENEFRYLYKYKSRNISSDDLIPIMITPFNLTEPYSPLLAGYNDLVLSNTKSAIDKNLTENYSRPDIIVSVQNAKSDDLERLVSSIEAKLRGANNAGGVLGISDKINLDTIDKPDYKIGDDPNFAKKICSYFKFPFAKIDTIASNRASAETVENAWLNDIKIYNQLYADSLTKNLLPEFTALEAGAYIYPQDLSIPDKEFKLKETTTLYTTGVITRSEARNLVGYDSTESDEIYAKRLNPIQIIEQELENKKGETNE